MYIPGTCECPLFWSFNPPKQGLFESKQGAPFGFQVHILYTSTYMAILRLWPFWHGENVALSKAVGVLQRSKIKFGHFESPWCIFLMALLYIFNFNYLAKWSYFTNLDLAEIAGGPIFIFQFATFRGPRFCEVAIISPELYIISVYRSSKYAWMSQEFSKWLVTGIKPTSKWGILGL